MHVGGCLFLITIVASNFRFLIADPQPREREKRHLLPLLGFLQGYRIGQNFALQLPPVVLSPILVLPSVNQQQSVNVQGSTEDNYEDNSGTVQIISPAKLVLNDCNQTREPANDEEAEEIDNVLSENKIDRSEDETFRQNNIGTTNSSLQVINRNNNNSVITSTESADITLGTATIQENVTTESGPYPTAIYKNEIVNTITFTESPIDLNLMLPSTENNWENFRSQRNTESNKTQESVEGRSDAWNNEIIFPTKPSNGYTRYPYPPSYNNVDDIYVTKSYNHRGHSQYSNNDRWQTFSSSGNYQMTSQFRPLAGLYYDGYLHQSPIKSAGFVPYNNNNYYYH